MPDKLKKKYDAFSFVNILSIDTPLNEAVKISDVCITSYSTSAFEFVKKRKPIVWINNVTSNSLFFSDLHKNMGFVARNTRELEDIIRKLKDDIEYYCEQQDLHFSQFRKFAYSFKHGIKKSFSAIIDEELEKV